jgi:hypothetical protein
VATNILMTKLSPATFADPRGRVLYGVMFSLILAACATSGGGAATPAQAPPPVPAPRGVRVPLEYQIPKQAGPGEIGPAVPGDVSIAEFTEGRRGEPSNIGVNSEDNIDYPVYTPSNVLSVATEAFRQEFQRLYSGAADSKAASHAIQGQVLKFWIIGGWTYRAEVRLRITVVDNRAGKAVYDRTIDADAHNWGKPRSPENNATAMNEALGRAVNVALRDPAFAQALGAAGTPPAVVQPAAASH